MAYNILFFTYVQHLFDPEAKVSLKAFLTPTNITTAIMVVMLVSGLRLPGILESFCKAMGNTTTPLALIIAGGMLARSDLKKLVANPLVWYFPWAFWLCCVCCPWIPPCGWRC